MIRSREYSEARERVIKAMADHEDKLEQSGFFSVIAHASRTKLWRAIDEMVQVAESDMVRQYEKGDR